MGKTYQLTCSSCGELLPGEIPSEITFPGVITCLECASDSAMPMEAPKARCPLCKTMQRIVGEELFLDREFACGHKEHVRRG